MKCRQNMSFGVQVSDAITLFSQLQHTAAPWSCSLCVLISSFSLSSRQSTTTITILLTLLLGAGGKGGPTRTFAIDRDAAIHTIRASFSRPSINTFLMVSYMGSRRVKPSWWDDSNWQATLDVNNGALANYHKAKLAADECLTKLAAERAKKDGKFRAINLRPGSLTEEPAGKVELGKTKAARGKVSREVVAQVAAALLEREGANGWLDLLDGDEDVQNAVDRVVKEGVDCVEGEDVSAMQARL